MEIIWSPQSLEDIKEIGNDIAKDSPQNARKFLAKMTKIIERLQDFPESGALVEENPMFRHIIYKGYRVIYYIESNVVNIITVLSPGKVFQRPEVE